MTGLYHESADVCFHVTVHVPTQQTFKRVISLSWNSSRAYIPLSINLACLHTPHIEFIIYLS